MIRFWRRVKFLFQFNKSIPFLKDFFLSTEVRVTTKLLSLLLIVGYAIFPFDIIPDFFLIFGVLDDVAIASFILQQIVKIAPESLKLKHGLDDKKAR
ncbi:YkvA family protein [Aquibacillus albus]|uniref:Uncharacterized membrane protein YkvA (DUF1232 family) n=1 Tax=Aquibacillus albus TaxID=1168171 RepID=A0ABS2MZ67_9BACI|nr:DUF1232 domain-containing protein [Aquibacillus albus]MBM7571103.1 uncharacterized membrane protein YkvA (DUF1232 family) [Aquibacillus albus]